MHVTPWCPRVLLENPFVRLAIGIAFMFMATFGSLLYFVFFNVPASPRSTGKVEVY